MTQTELNAKINLATKTLRLDGRQLGGHVLLQITYVNDNAHLHSSTKNVKNGKYLRHPEI